MNQQHYLNKVKSHPNVSNAEIKDNNIIAYSDVKEKQQLGWNIICDVYDASFTKHINQIIVK